MRENLAFLAASELSNLYRRRELSPVDVIASARTTYERVNPQVNAIVTPAWSDAEEAARRSASRLELGQGGPLEGIPIAIKDNIDTAGIRTTYGSRAFATHVPRADAVHVARLKAAGAIVIGKTNTPEFAMGVNTRNALFGATRCPWDQGRSAAGSSGGSAAAVVSGMCVLADGTDHGGSIRIPAAINGVVGLRPTVGLVPSYPAPWLFDTFSVPGPLARRVADVTLMLSVMAGADEHAPLSQDGGRALRDDVLRDTRVLRIAWSPDLGGLFPVEPAVSEIACAAARWFESVGCAVCEDAPNLRGIEEVIRALRVMRTAVVLRGRAVPAERIDSATLRAYEQRALGLSGLDIARAEGARSHFAETLSRFLDRYDILLLPTAQWVAFDVNDDFPKQIGGHEVEDMVSAILSTYAFSVLGVPAVSVPCGFSEEGLPVGLQIVGPWRSDASLLRIAAEYQEAHEWTARHPALP